MNELERVVKGLDVLETLTEFEDEMVVQEHNLKEVFIFENDINNMKNFLKKAYYQLNNLEIEVREE